MPNLSKSSTQSVVMLQTSDCDSDSDNSITADMPRAITRQRSMSFGSLLDNSQSDSSADSSKSILKTNRSRAITDRSTFRGSTSPLRKLLSQTTDKSLTAEEMESNLSDLKDPNMPILIFKEMTAADSPFSVQSPIDLKREPFEADCSCLPVLVKEQVDCECVDATKVDEERPEETSTPAMKRKVIKFMKKHFPEHRSEPSAKLKGILEKAKKESHHLFDGLITSFEEKHHIIHKEPLEDEIPPSPTQKSGDLPLHSHQSSLSSVVQTSVEKLQPAPDIGSSEIRSPIKSIFNLSDNSSPPGSSANSDDGQDHHGWHFLKFHFAKKGENKSPAPSEHDSTGEVHYGHSRNTSLSKRSRGFSESFRFGEIGGLPRTNSQDSFGEKYGKRELVIGKGAFATVRVVHKREKDAKWFAVKEFRKKRREESEKEYIKKVIAEFCISSSLHHANVVETVDLIKDEVCHLCNCRVVNGVK